MAQGAGSAGGDRWAAASRDRPAVAKEVELARAGDAGGLRALYVRLRPEALLLLRRLYGDLPEAEHEEVVQEAFLELFQWLTDLLDPRAVRSWFRTVLLRAAGHRRRRDRLEREVRFDYAYLRSLGAGVQEGLRRERRRVVRESIEANRQEIPGRLAEMAYIQGLPAPRLRRRPG